MDIPEILFKKFVNWRWNKKKNENTLISCKLTDIQKTLSLICKAICAEPIDIYPAIQYGGYKGIHFYFPEKIAYFQDKKLNESFYIFRAIYLSYHYLNSKKNEQLQHEEVFQIMDNEFPNLKELREYFWENLEEKKCLTDTSIEKDQWHGSTEIGNQDQHDYKKNNQNQIQSELKSKPVESISLIQLNQEKQEEYMLTHNFEKIETAEEFDEIWRDFDGDDNIQDHAAALDELNLKHVIRVDDIVHSIYKAEYTGQLTLAECNDLSQSNFYYPYPEWQYQSRKYIADFCKVFPLLFKSQNSDIGNSIIKNSYTTIQILKKELARFYNQMATTKRLAQGDELDTDQVNDLFIDIKAGKSPNENIYESKRKRKKELAILFLIDISLSSDSYVQNQKVLDIEKKAILIMGEVLKDYDVHFQVDAFFSKTRNFCTYITLKHFKQKWTSAISGIGNIQAQGFTRMGPALRHAKVLLDQVDLKSKWIILLSDGKPTDYDKYEGKYGVEDIKQALKELHQNSINIHAIAIEENSKYYLPQMFGKDRFTILSHSEFLPVCLQNIYRKIAFSQ